MKLTPWYASAPSHECCTSFLDWLRKITVRLLIQQACSLPWRLPSTAARHSSLLWQHCVCSRYLDCAAVNERKGRGEEKADGARCKNKLMWHGLDVVGVFRDFWQVIRVFSPSCPGPTRFLGEEATLSGLVLCPGFSHCVSRSSSCPVAVSLSCLTPLFRFSRSSALGFLSFSVLFSSSLSLSLWSLYRRALGLVTVSAHSLVSDANARWYLTVWRHDLVSLAGPISTRTRYAHSSHSGRSSERHPLMAQLPDVDFLVV